MAFAAPETFDFKDPKGVNNARFTLDAPLEAVNGSASGITGTITFDPAAPGAAKGKIVVASSSLTVPNTAQLHHMQGEQWLNVATYPEISFEAKELKNVQTSGDVTTADVTGTFTLKGISKDIAVPVKFTYLKDKLGQRMPEKWRAICWSSARRSPSSGAILASCPGRWRTRCRTPSN